MVSTAWLTPGLAKNFTGLHEDPFEEFRDATFSVPTATRSTSTRMWWFQTSSSPSPLGPPASAAATTPRATSATRTSSTPQRLPRAGAPSTALRLTGAGDTWPADRGIAHHALRRLHRPAPRRFARLARIAGAAVAVHCCAGLPPRRAAPRAAPPRLRLLRVRGHGLPAAQTPPGGRRWRAAAPPLQGRAPGPRTRATAGGGGPPWRRPPAAAAAGGGGPCGACGARLRTGRGDPSPAGTPANGFDSSCGASVAEPIRVTLAT